MKRLMAILFVVALALLALLVSLLPTMAHAQAARLCPAQPTCVPEFEHDRSKCGMVFQGEDATGRWRVQWWQYTFPDGVKAWCNKRWACLTKYCPGGTSLLAQASSVLAAAVDVATGLAQVEQQFAVTPAPGTQEEFDYLSLHYHACQVAQATVPAGFTYTCPLSPPAPPTAASIWRVNGTGSSVYPVVNGKPGVPVPGKRAAGNTLCSCTTLKVVSGPYTYCAYDGSAANEVALCVKAAQ